MLATRDGLTLTSLMVAVGLSGVLALAAMRLVVNQMNALRVMELKDKGDAIYKFYSNLLHDDKVWWCTLYDRIDDTITGSNYDMRQCIFGEDRTKCFTAPGGTALRLVGPDCEFKELLVSGRIKHRFHSDGGYDFGKVTIGGVEKKNFESSSVTFIPEGGKTLKDSVVTADSSGWWDVELKWREMGSGAIDLIFTQKLDQDKWQNATSPKRYLPELKDSEGTGRVLRVRRSTNYVPTDGCAAVVSIGLHTAGRRVSCSGDKPVNTAPPSRVHACSVKSPRGQVVRSTAPGVNPANPRGDCTRSRVSVTPTDCSGSSSVIWKIGLGVKYGTSIKLEEDNNVECALKGRGKMVRYGSCPGTAVDVCAGFAVSTPLHNAIHKINSDGSFECATLMGFPTATSRSLVAESGATYTATGQGPIGPPGLPGEGPTGHPGSPGTCR